MTRAIYAFSGDPITYGHINIIERAAKDFDAVVVGIGVNPDKKYMFSLEEREEMARRSLIHLKNVEVVSFKGLLAYYAKEQKIPIIVRGIRNENDRDIEETIAKVNKDMGVDTKFYEADHELEHVSSSMVKALQKEHGPIHKYVPLYIKQKLEERMSNQYMIGVTGEIGSGKSYVSKKFVEVGKDKEIDVHNIELDHIWHNIISKRMEPLYVKTRKDIVKSFGKDVELENGFINTKVLGEIVFNDYEALRDLNKIADEPVRIRFNREIYEKKGLILINAALIAEAGISHLCNNNVVLITVDKESQRKRLKRRESGDNKLTDEQIERRLASQYGTNRKKEELEKLIEKHNQGKIWILENSDSSDQKNIEGVFDEVVKYLGVK